MKPKFPALLKRGFLVQPIAVPAQAVGAVLEVSSGRGESNPNGFDPVATSHTVTQTLSLSLSLGKNKEQKKETNKEETKGVKREKRRKKGTQQRDDAHFVGGFHFGGPKSEDIALVVSELGPMAIGNLLGVAQN